MSFPHHWADEEEPTYEEKRDRYVESVDNDPLASLNEIKNVHYDAEFDTAEEFCRKHGL